MSKKLLYLSSTISLITIIFFSIQNFNKSSKIVTESERIEYEKFINEHNFSQIRYTQEEISEIPKRDRPDLAMEQDYLATMNPATGRPEKEKLFPILTMTKQMQQNSQTTAPGNAGSPWVERGPDNVGGRTRALAWDPTTANKVWVGSVTGGLWYNNDITNAGSTWQAVNDFWDNIAVTAIAFDPNTPATIYIGTGEGWGAGASRGAGIWKSIDGGTSFSQISSTTTYHYINDLVVRNESGSSVVYAAVARKYYEGQWHGTGEGIQRSTNGGTSWTNVLTDGTYEPTDIDLSGDNTIFVGTDGGKVYSSTNGTAFTLRHTHTSTGRVNLACAPSDANYIYAAFEAGSELSAFKQSTNGGGAWTSMSEPNDDDGGIPATDFTRGQAWYDLTLDVDPNNRDVVMIGGIDIFRTSNGGTSWTQSTHWYGGFGHQEVHADQHAIVYKPGSSTEVMFGNDGGVFYTSNGNNTTPTINSRINGYNVTQYYACAIHPTAGTNNFLAGAQDNGTQRYLSAGINSTTEATGGDGGFCFIDQSNGQYQFTSYVYNSWRRSTNSGANFSTIQNDQSTGRFINPGDYDDNQDVLYSARNTTTIQRITSATGTYNISDFTVAGLGSIASHLSVSPYTTTSTTLFIGTSSGRVFKTTNAQGTPVSTEITGGSFPTGEISCIAIGANENELLVTFSNYGITSVWYTSNGGGTWVSKEGDLPDMPVRWALFNPNDYNEVILATEVGVWTTTALSSGSPNWTTSNSGLANVRVDMLQMRTSDYEVLAATYGRGLFSSDGFNGSALFTANFNADNTTPNILQTVTFTDLTNLSPTNWTWTFSPATVTYQGGTNANSQNPQVTFDNTGLYTVTLLASNGVDNDAEIKTDYINVSSPAPCDASSTATNYEYISNVTFNTINNTTASSGYADYTAMSTSLSKGNSYNMDVTYTDAYTTNEVKVWIDFNQNFDFTDPGEEFSFPQGVGTGSPYTLAIAIPAGALTGTTTMRVRLHDTAWNPQPLSCGDSGSGEVEDYTVNIQGASSITWTNQAANTTIECDESILPANTGSATATTTCGTGGLNVTYIDITAAGACANESIITRTWTATDNCANSENFDQTITIEDNTAPAITCPSNQNQNATNGVDDLLADYTGMATATDNCSAVGNISVMQSPAIGSTQNVGTVSVTLTATDECGNSSNCNFDVTITNTSSITWTNQPTNTTIECDESNTPTNTGSATATTTCGSGGINVVYADATSTGTCTNASTIIRTWTATDNCGNSENYAQTITIEDNTAPTISCPTSQNQNATNGTDDVLADYTTMATISDNCSTNGNITVTQSPAIGSTQNVGTISITLTATDECGNSTNCNFNVTITNNSSITWTNQPPNTTIECNDSNLPTNTGSAIASTTCGSGGLNFVYSDATSAGSCANASTITRTWRATDNCGNSENHVQIVTIEDNTAPIVTCPATQNQNATNGTDDMLAVYTAIAAVNDNCSSIGNITVTQSPAIGSIQNIGTVNVTLTATDECGNASNCNFDVNITTTVGIAESTRVEISIYPNPNQGLFQLDLGSGKNQDVSVRIYSLLGSIVYDEQNIETNGIYNLDLLHVEKGIYYVSIKTEEETIIKKILIM